LDFILTLNNKNSMPMDENEIQQLLNQITEKKNSTPLTNFEGYSPTEMQLILYSTNSQNSPFRLMDMPEEAYQNIPIFNQIKFLGDYLIKNGEIKLTKTGALPTKLVSNLYLQGYLQDRMLEKGIPKQMKETDSLVTHLPKVILELSGLVKKRFGKLSLTKAAPKIMANPKELLKTIWETYTIKFNWSYNDGYGNNNIGQLGCAYTLILLSKYGDEEKTDSFYAKKYFEAFPMLRNIPDPGYSTIEKYTNNCFSYRTIDVFMRFFGLAKINGTHRFLSDTYTISKSEVFDKLINNVPPAYF
jgi:hypothetical protein